MRVHQERSGSLFSYVSIEERSRQPSAGGGSELADQALDRLNSTFCDLLCAGKAGPLGAPEQLLAASFAAGVLRDSIGSGCFWRAAPLQPGLFSLFRWFVGLSPDDPIWHPHFLPRTASGFSMTTSMGRFPGEADGPLQRSSRCSATSTFQWMQTLLQACASHAVRWSGIAGMRTHRHRHQVLARALHSKARQESRAKGDFPQHSSSATRRLAPASIQTPCWPASPNAHPAQPATGGTLLMDNRHALNRGLSRHQASGQQS